MIRDEKIPRPIIKKLCNMTRPLVRGATGFTMIETMVVATIFSIIALGIGTSFLSGMKLWSRIKNTDFVKYYAFVSLEAVSQELRQSVNVPLIGFEGKSQEFSFPSLIGDSVYKISYRYEPERNKLIRRQAALKDIMLDKEENNFTEKDFLSVDMLTVSYFSLEKQVYVWKDSWVKDNGMFSAIKLEVKIKDEEFTKIIFIPTS